MVHTQAPSSSRCGQALSSAAAEKAARAQAMADAVAAYPIRRGKHEFFSAAKQLLAEAFARDGLASYEGSRKEETSRPGRRNDADMEGGTSDGSSGDGHEGVPRLTFTLQQATAGVPDGGLAVQPDAHVLASQAPTSRMC